MLNTLRKIAECTQMTLRPTILQGKDASVSAVRQWFLQEQKRPHTVLFFYFSGHGMKHKTLKPWPYLSLSLKKQLLDMNEIISLIESMKSRLSLVLSDCCNSSASAKGPIQNSKEPFVFQQKKFTKGALKLFRKTKGHIRATAATPGQFGIGTEKGGLFTLSFLFSLMTTCQDKNPSWNDVFNKTSSVCSAMNAQFSHVLQIPYVDVRVRTQK